MVYSTRSAVNHNSQVSLMFKTTPQTLTKGLGPNSSTYILVNTVTLNKVYIINQNKFSYKT